MSIETQNQAYVKPLEENPAQPPLSGFKRNVPTEDHYLSLYNSSLLKIRSPRGPQQGHYDGLLIKPLTAPGLFFKYFDELYPVLLCLLGSKKKAEVLKEALRLQACRGECFPSTKFLAARAHCSEKTVDRCFAQLREMGLLVTYRTSRTDGTLSVNLIDLEALWRAIKALVINARGLVQKIGRRFWIKVTGLWVCPPDYVKGQRGRAHPALPG